jgi:hypothetical protein
MKSLELKTTLFLVEYDYSRYDKEVAYFETEKAAKAFIDRYTNKHCYSVRQVDVNLNHSYTVYSSPDDYDYDNEVLPILNKLTSQEIELLSTYFKK